MRRVYKMWQREEAHEGLRTGPMTGEHEQPEPSAKHEARAGEQAKDEPQHTQSLRATKGCVAEEDESSRSFHDILAQGTSRTVPTRIARDK